MLRNTEVIHVKFELITIYFINYLECKSCKIWLDFYNWLTLCLTYCRINILKAMEILYFMVWN